MKIIFIFIIYFTNFIIPPCSLNKQGETYVYICTGKNAYRYHNNIECRGLNQCSDEIKKVTLEYAKKKKRTPCKICY